MSILLSNEYKNWAAGAGRKERGRDIIGKRREVVCVRVVGNSRDGRSMVALRRRPRSSSLGVPSAVGLG